MQGDIDKLSETTPLALELERLLGKLDPDGSKRAANPGSLVLQRAWENCAGKQIADITRNLTLRKTELIVSVSTPIWAQELSLLSEDYRAKLNSALAETLPAIGKTPIQTLTFRVRNQ